MKVLGPSSVMKSKIASAGAPVLALAMGSVLLLGSALVAGEKSGDAAGQSVLWEQVDANKDGYISADEASAAGPSTNPAIDLHGVG